VSSNLGIGVTVFFFLSFFIYSYRRCIRTVTDSNRAVTLFNYMLCQSSCSTAEAGRKTDKVTLSLSRS
jgi:hypothetical protein